MIKYNYYTALTCTTLCLAGILVWPENYILMVFGVYNAGLTVLYKAMSKS